MGIELRKTEIKSESGDSDIQNEIWTVRGTNDIDAVKAAINSGTGVTFPVGFTGVDTTINGLSFRKLHVKHGEEDPHNWKAICTYLDQSNPTPVVAPPPVSGDEEINFDITSLTRKTTQSIDNVSKTHRSASKTAPDYKGGIGWNGKVFEGTDAYYPALSFSVTKHWPVAVVTNSFIALMRNVAFKTNNATWRGFQKGEVLFAGATGGRTSNDLFSINYKFLTAEKRSNFNVGDITGLSKEGWEYLWILYQKEKDDAVKHLTPRPLAAYVEKMYEEESFPNRLGLAA